jgi:hypothetical protein
MSETAKAARAEKGPPKGWFTIEITMANDNEPSRVFIGADGRDFWVQRGKKVTVPPQVLSVLDDAIVTADEVDPDNPDRTIPVERKRFAYSVIQAH